MAEHEVRQLVDDLGDGVVGALPNLRGDECHALEEPLDVGVAAALGEETGGAGVLLGVRPPELAEVGQLGLVVLAEHRPLPLLSRA